MKTTQTIAAKIGITISMITIMGSLIWSCTPAHAENGIASVYTQATNRGTRTASGTVFRDRDLTAAHRKLPFGTKVRVTNRRNGRSVVVTITDRGPFVRGRIIDLTLRGAAAIGMGYGLAAVTVERLR